MERLTDLAPYACLLYLFVAIASLAWFTIALRNAVDEDEYLHNTKRNHE